MHEHECKCGQPHTVVVKQERELPQASCSESLLACTCGVPMLGLGTFLVLTLIMTAWEAIFG